MNAVIYAHFAKQYPRQIVAICIRNVLASTDKHPFDKIFADIEPRRWLVSQNVEEMRHFISDFICA